MNDVIKIGSGWPCPIGKNPVMKDGVPETQTSQWPGSIPIWRRQRRTVERSFGYAFMRAIIEKIY